jgi:membrane protein DedA with SNARE-associated domain
VSGWLEHTSTWLVDNGWAPYLFVLLLFIAFAEASFFLGFVLPGETALVLGGALSGTGVFTLAVFLPCAVLAAIVGDSVGYEVGARYGERIKVSRAGRRIGPARWETAHRFFDDHGGKAVFLGRGQALLRALVPALAGMSKLAYRTFLPWNALGALVWGGGVVLLGYFFAHSISSLETGLKYWTYGFIAALLALVVVLVLRRRGRERAEVAAVQAELNAGTAEGSEA